MRTGGPPLSVPPPPPLPLKSVFYGLFFHPHVMLLLVQGNGRSLRALRVVSLLCLLAGVLIGFARLPGLLRGTRDWAAWFARETNAVWIEADTLRWERPDAMPYTTRHRGWRVDFVADGMPFAPEHVGDSLESRGLWFAPGDVFVWWREAGGRVRRTVLLDNGKVAGVFALSRIWPAGMRIEGEQFGREARRMLWHAFPALLAKEAVAVFAQVMLYALLFSLVPSLMRASGTTRGFRGILNFHLYACIPPLIVATVYAALDLPYLDLNTVFVGAFVVYLLFTFTMIRRALAETPPGRR